MNDAIQFFIRLGVASDKRDAWQALMHEMVAATTKEPGSLVYQWHLGDGGGTCYIHECYADQAACDVHIDGFVTNFAGRFLDIASNIRFYVSGDPSAKVREILAGLEPDYFALAAGFNRLDQA